MREERWWTHGEFNARASERRVVWYAGTVGDAIAHSGDRLDRIERILEQVARRQHEMAARQQYHDEAFERFDAEMKVLREAIALDAENIRALARVAELHHERLNRLEGDEEA